MAITLGIAGACVGAGEAGGGIIWGVGTGGNVALALGKLGNGGGSSAQADAKTSTPERQSKQAFLLANTRNHP